MTDERYEEYEDEGLENEEADVEDEATEDEGSQDQTLTLSQDEFDQKIKQLTAKERARFEKKMQKLFGTKDLNRASEYYQAGYAVSQAAGKQPNEVLSRLKGRQQQQPQQGNYQQAQPDDAVMAEVNELKSMLMEQREEEAKSHQEQEAKKEFGKLYEDHQDDIEDMAEERGLSLVDAAAVVLRPQLKELYENRTTEKKKNQRRRKVEGTDEGPSKDTDVQNKLSPEMKRTAQRMGLSYKEYFNHAKSTGLISE